MKVVWRLTEAEQITLREAVANHPKHRCRIRAHAILLSHKRYDIKQLADIFDTSLETLSKWIDCWEEFGISSLYDAKRTGRPTIYTDEEKQRLKELVDEEPHQLKRAQSLMEKESGKKASVSTIKRTLKKNLTTAIKEPDIHSN